MTEELQNKALAEQIVSKAIQNVVYKYNAYAPIISSFRIAYTDIVPTMGVDKYARLIINPDFLVENQTHAEGLIIHETLHIFFGHTTDQRSKLAYTDDAQHNRIANIAEDCAINQFINESLPSSAIIPCTLSEALNNIRVAYNQDAEFYYDLIVNNTPQKEQQQLANGVCSTDITNSQATQDALDKMGIEHISEEEVNSKVMDTAVAMVKAKENQYGALSSFAKELLEPQVDWRPLLQSAVRNAEKKVWTIHSHPTYKRVSRRSQQILIPKRYGHKISVSLSFDTSGSISQDMVNQFLSEVQNCLRYSDVKECALWHASVYWYGTPEQLAKDIEKIFESGGTDSRCVEECAEHRKADIHFTFTDGYWGPDPKRTDKCRVGELYSIRWDGKTITEIRKEF